MLYLLSDTNSGYSGRDRGDMWGWIRIRCRVIRQIVIGPHSNMGFLTVSTRSYPRRTSSRRRFQSRRGFSLRRDPGRPPRARATTARFNPVLGFLSVATVDRHVGDDRARNVSIPCWVFSPSRRRGRGRCGPIYAGFNPVLGFLPKGAHRLDRTLPRYGSDGADPELQGRERAITLARQSEGRAPRNGSPTARGTTAGRTDPTTCGAGAEGHSLIHIVLLDIDHRWLAW